MIKKKKKKKHTLISEDYRTFETIYRYLNKDSRNVLKMYEV